MDQDCIWTLKELTKFPKGDHMRLPQKSLVKTYESCSKSIRSPKINMRLVEDLTGCRLSFTEFP